METTTTTNNRTIGFHPCVGKKADGQERPTTVVIRTADGKHVAHEFEEQSLLDFFTCGAPISWRNATVEDIDAATRPAHHLRWVEAKQHEYDGFVPSNPDMLQEEQEKLFRIVIEKCRVVGHQGAQVPATTYQRAQVPAELVTLNPLGDIVGVASGGLGYQILEILLARYPEIDIRTIGSGTLKERRPEFDALLPKALQKKATKLRLVAEASDAPASEGSDASDVEDTEEDEEAEVSKSAAKDANAKFDAHRIAYALANEEALRLFHRCSARDRDWAAVNIAYDLLERARKARVATEQQFRQLHRIELRRLIKDPRVPSVVLASTDEGADQSIEALLASYERTLRTCGQTDRNIARKLETLRQSHARIEGARAYEDEMDKNLKHALEQLPEYTEFLPRVKAMVHPESQEPLGKFIGERIFGRWIAGIGSPMASRLNEPMRQSDIERIATRRQTLSEVINALDRSGLPDQPVSGGGKTREWLLACERVVSGRIETADADERELAQIQLDQIKDCRNAYRRLTNARKNAANRPLDRVIAYMGLHVRNGGKYAGTPKDLEFPRKRKGGRANWNEKLLRQGAYQWALLIIKGSSHWKTCVYLPYKERLIARGVKRGHAHKRAMWRMASKAVRWLIQEWFAWERRQNADSLKTAA